MKGTLLLNIFELDAASNQFGWLILESLPSKSVFLPQVVKYKLYIMMEVHNVIPGGL